MNCGNCLPVFDTHEQCAGAYDIVQRSTGRLQSSTNDLQAAARLGSSISGTRRATVWPYRSRTGDRDNVTHAHRARKPDLGLERAAAGNELAHAVA